MTWMRLISEIWFHSEVSSEKSLSSLPSFKRPILLQLNLDRLTLRTRVDPFWYQDWTSPYYNDSHKKVRRAIREFTGSSSLSSLSLSSLSPRPPSELNLICPFHPSRYLPYAERLRLGSSERDPTFGIQTYRGSRDLVCDRCRRNGLARRRVLERDSCTWGDQERGMGCFS